VGQVVGDPTGVEPLDAIPVDERDRTGLVALVSWALLLVVVVTAGWWIWNKVLFPDAGDTITRYADSDAGEWYESASDQFRAVFPTTPDRHARDDTDGRTVTVVSRPGSGYEFSVTRQPAPVEALESYPAFLNQLAGTLAADADGEIVSQGAPQRLPAMETAQKEIIFRAGDEYHHVWLVLASDRVYVIDATTPDGDEDDRAALRFRLGFTKLGA
jgi:hypothetical protein